MKKFTKWAIGSAATLVAGAFAMTAYLQTLSTPENDLMRANIEALIEDETTNDF